MGEKSDVSRRHFLKGAALSAAALAFAPYAKANGQTADKRVAAAMWDFSWLTRRAAPEAEYLDWDKVLDGLAERGYNCVRIDAFPNLVASGPDGKIQDRFTLLPQKPGFMWGNHHNVEVEPRAGLIDFMSKCKARKIRVGFSAWYQPDKTWRVRMLNTPQDFTRVWTETISLVESAGLVDIIEWVDLGNEFPSVGWEPGAQKYLSQQTGTQFLSGLFTEKEQEVLGHFFNDSIKPLKARWPNLRYCYSLSLADSRNVSKVDFSSFGILEPHLWLNMNPSFVLGSGLLLPLLTIPHTTNLVRGLAGADYRAFRSHWLKWMDSTLAGWQKLADKWGLPLYTTEAWGPINYEDVPRSKDAGEWKWVKDVCSRCVELAVAHGWKGIATSNFCGPQFHGMWDDVAWHKNATRIIRA